MKTEGKNKCLSLLLLNSGILCLLVFLVSTKLVIAGPEKPDFYYYSDGRKTSLRVSTQMVAVRFKPVVTLEQQITIVESEENLAPFSEREELPIFKLTRLPLREGLTEEDIIHTIQSLNAKSEVQFACPVFDLPNANLIVTDEFLVKFAPSVPEAQIKAFNALNNVEIAGRSELTDWYLLRVKEPANMNALRTANLYHDDPITVYTAPNFVMRLEQLTVTPDDTYFADQWALNNTGQTGGTPDADIDAPEGWQITTGSSEIVIAIIDEGVDLTHEDLIRKLVDGKDTFENDDDPSPWGHDAHGTACAGLAAADTNNGEGIAGVCPDCKIMPIRVAKGVGGGFWDTDWWKLGNGIIWAANHGADVLSNSWSCPDWNYVHDAIIYAKDNGRDGKGCVIVFASGNDNGPVSYPAKYDEVIAVGATDHNDVRWQYSQNSGSNFGDELDVVAPSGWTQIGGVISWTTDITGSAGYNHGDTSKGDAAGNYTKWFGGTSGATPKVAGLAGLILSVDPELTADDVCDVIVSTVDDLGEPGKNPNYGWGRINVYNALLQAVPSKGHIDLDEDYYNCDCNVGIFLADADLEGQGSQDVNITCGDDLETVTLTERTPAIGVFTGTVSTASGDPNTQDGILQVSHGQTITGTYEDANDGTGNPASPNDTAVVDCVYPVISNLDFNEAPIGPDNITVSFDTNEFTYTRVLYGQSCGDPNKTSTLSRGLNHTVKLKEVSPWTGYYFIVEAVDLADNETIAVWLTSYEDANAVLKGFTVRNASSNGVYVISSAPIISNCIIENNNSVSGIICQNAVLTIINNMIRENHKWGIYCIHSAAPTIMNNWIYNNNTGGVSCDTSLPTVLRNNTIVSNSIYGILATGAAPGISNCILWDNVDELTNCSATYSCIQDANDAKGTGNITNDPCFVNIYDFRDKTVADGTQTTIIVAYANSYDPNDVIEYDNDSVPRTVTDVNTATDIVTFANHPLEANSVAGVRIYNWGVGVTDVNEDFHLDTNSSPCFNAGDPNFQPESGETDIDGDDRLMDGRVDMGADELACLSRYDDYYDNWLYWDKPDCWCYQRQCRGDADGQKQGLFWVSINDSNKVQECINKLEANLPDGCECADFDHHKQGLFWVSLNDLAIIQQYINKLEEDVPTCEGVVDENFWTN